MSATIATFQAMLKQQLEPKIQDQIDWQDVLLEDSLNVDGKNKEGIEVDLKNNKFEITSLVWGMTGYASSEGWTLINSDVDLGTMFVVPKYTNASFRLGHEAIQVTLKDQASLEKAVSLYTLESRRCMMRTKGRFLRWDGTGIVWVLPIGVQSGTAITISGKTVGTIASENRYGLGALKMFQPGAEISIGTESAFAGWTQIDWVIETVDSDTQITLTASVTVWTTATGNNRAGTNADTWHIRFKWEYGNAPMGLLGLIDDGTLSPGITSIQNVTRASTPYMKSVVSIKANASTIIADFQDLYSDFVDYNQNPKYFIVSKDVYKKYSNSITITVQANQGTTPYTSKLGVGHSGLMFAFGWPAIPIMMDNFLPFGTVILEDPEFLFCADLFADGFIEDGIMVRVPWTKLYETVRCAYYNYGTYGSRKLWARIHYNTL